MMFLPGAVFILGSSWYLEQALIWNGWKSLQIGLTAGVPAIILAAIAWRWPLLGGAIAFGSALPVLLFWFLHVLGGDSDPTFVYTELVGTIIFLIGSILVFTSAGKAGSSGS